MPPPAIEHVSLAPAPVPLLLSLQRSAGNQAVQRLLRGHSPGAALQRFAQPDEKKPDFRVSKNRMIVVQGKKDLFADEEAIGEANTALAQVAGGKGSYLKLKGEKVDVPGFPGLMRVTPLWLGREGEMPALMGTLNQINKQDPTKYMSHADCHMTAQTIMGSRDEPSGIKDSEKAIVTGFTEDELTQTAIEPIAKAKTEGKISDHGANRVLDQFLITALPR